MGYAVEGHGHRRNNMAEVLVLFILLVIITMSFAW
ncbi:sporulation protein YjcZ [Paenibacillus sp. LMG 31458]|uniref:Sporulation protein YjcZ n=2 Tax=Paenibacillus TaxID=44249 RepID=A0ABX1Z5V7_9BACL|nr:sporulation protein YjcZ [Paenibacillus phytorum]NOU88623.1 sporulation protein YjcZ [Paenibacillus germinis]